MGQPIKIFEVGPRDGLQNISTMISTSDKIQLVDLLSQCGYSNIETTSFVSPKWVPQMADAEAVLTGITRKPGIQYCALTPNIRGYNRAKSAKADEIAVFSAASETFSQKNTNCSIAESIRRFDEVFEAAKTVGIKVRGYISCVVECPYEGKISPDKIAELAELLLNKGCYEISLGDTIGKGSPQSITQMLEGVLNSAPANKLAGHFHDTNGNAVANILVSAQMGISTFDTAVGGLGGCPYAPGAKGNVSSRDAILALGEAGYSTGINLDALAIAETFLLKILGNKSIDE